MATAMLRPGANPAANPVGTGAAQRGDLAQAAITFYTQNPEATADEFTQYLRQQGLITANEQATGDASGKVGVSNKFDTKGWLEAIAEAAGPMLLGAGAAGAFGGGASAADVGGSDLGSALAGQEGLDAGTVASDLYGPGYAGTRSLVGAAGPEVVGTVGIPAGTTGAGVLSGANAGSVPASVTGPAATAGGAQQPWAKALGAFSQQQASNSANVLKAQQNEQQIAIDSQAEQQKAQQSAWARLNAANYAQNQPPVTGTPIPSYAANWGVNGTNPAMPNAATVAANQPGAKALGSQALSQLQSGSALPPNPATNVNGYGPGAASTIAGYGSLAASVPPSAWSWLANYL